MEDSTLRNKLDITEVGKCIDLFVVLKVNSSGQVQSALPTPQYLILFDLEKKNPKPIFLWYCEVQPKPLVEKVEN